MLTGLIIGFAGGLVVGWFFLPEPAFLRRMFIKWGWAKPTVLALLLALGLSACSSNPKDANCPWVGPACDKR